MLPTNTLRSILLIVLLVLSGASQASVVSAGVNVWTSLGPEHAGIYSLAIDPATPTTIYAGTNGVLKSTNSGGSWINTGPANSGVTALAIDPATPATLYAGTSGGVFRSTNGGANWSWASSGLTAADIRALAIDPKTPATVYAGTSGGVFRSTNSGGNWVDTGLTAADIRALAIDPLTPATLYVGTGAGYRSYGRGTVFKSTDAGGNWSAVFSGAVNTYIPALAIDPLTPAPSMQGKLHRPTTEAGACSKAWTAVGTG